MFVTRRPLWKVIAEVWSWLYAAKVIAWLHLVGGIAGLVTGGILSYPFFGLSIVAGVLVLRRHREGVEAALIVEIFQVIAFQLPSFAYQFASGIQLYLYVAGPRFGVSLSLQSRFVFGSAGPVSALAIDLFSLVAIPALWKAIKERDRREREAAALTAAA